MKRLTLNPAATVLIETRLIAAERFAIFDAATQKVKEKTFDRAFAGQRYTAAGSRRVPGRDWRLNIILSGNYL